MHFPSYDWVYVPSTPFISMQLHIVLVIFQFPRHFILYTKIIMAASIFSLRIVSTDHSMIEPIPGLDMTYSEFRRSQIYKVPVIRIFRSYIIQVNKDNMVILLASVSSR